MVQYGDDSEWKKMYDIALKETNAAEKLRFMRALTYSQNPRLLNL